MRGETSPIPIALQPVGKNDKVVNEMRAIYKEYFPEDPVDDKSDFRSCRICAVYINSNIFKWLPNSFESENSKDLLNYWKQLVFYASIDSFYCKIELGRMDSHIKGLNKSFRSTLTKKINGKSTNTDYQAGRTIVFD